MIRSVAMCLATWVMFALVLTVACKRSPGESPSQGSPQPEKAPARPAVDGKAVLSEDLRKATKAKLVEVLSLGLSTPLHERLSAQFKKVSSVSDALVDKMLSERDDRQAMLDVPRKLKILARLQVPISRNMRSHTDICVPRRHILEAICTREKAFRPMLDVLATARRQSALLTLSMMVGGDKDGNGLDSDGILDVIGGQVSQTIDRLPDADFLRLSQQVATLSGHCKLFDRALVLLDSIAAEMPAFGVDTLSESDVAKAVSVDFSEVARAVNLCKMAGAIEYLSTTPVSKDPELSQLRKRFADVETGFLAGSEIADKMGSIEQSVAVLLEKARPPENASGQEEAGGAAEAGTAERAEPDGSRR